MVYTHHSQVAGVNYLGALLKIRDKGAPFVIFEILQQSAALFLENDCMSGTNNSKKCEKVQTK
jgi:hypothetical protein